MSKVKQETIKPVSALRARYEAQIRQQSEEKQRVEEIKEKRKSFYGSNAAGLQARLKKVEEEEKKKDAFAGSSGSATAESAPATPVAGQPKKRFHTIGDRNSKTVSKPTAASVFAQDGDGGDKKDKTPSSEPKKPAVDPKLADFLQSCGLFPYCDQFAAQDITFDKLQAMDESGLSAVQGLPDYVKPLLAERLQRVRAGESAPNGALDLGSASKPADKADDSDSDDSDDEPGAAAAAAAAVAAAAAATTAATTAADGDDSKPTAAVGAEAAATDATAATDAQATTTTAADAPATTTAPTDAPAAAAATTTTDAPATTTTTTTSSAESAAAPTTDSTAATGATDAAAPPKSPRRSASVRKTTGSSTKKDLKEPKSPRKSSSTSKKSSSSSSKKAEEAAADAAASEEANKTFDAPKKRQSTKRSAHVTKHTSSRKSGTGSSAVLKKDRSVSTKSGADAGAGGGGGGGSGSTTKGGDVTTTPGAGSGSTSSVTAQPQELAKVVDETEILAVLDQCVKLVGDHDAERVPALLNSIVIDDMNKHVVRERGLAQLNRLLSYTSSLEIQEAAVAVLSQLSLSDASKFQDAMSGSILFLTTLIGVPFPKTQQHAMITLATVVYKHQQNLEICLKTKAVQLLLALINKAEEIDTVVLIDAIICLRALAEFNPSGQQAIYEAHGVPAVLRLLGHGNQEVQMSAIDAVLSLVRSNGQIKELVQGSIVTIVYLLSVEVESIRAVACGVLMELARDSERCQQIVFQCRAVEPLIACIKSHNEYMQFHALGIITFLILKNDDRRRAFVAAGLEEPVAQLLDSKNENIRTGANVISKILNAKKKKDDKDKQKTDRAAAGKKNDKKSSSAPKGKPRDA